jgi:hypothetical protein
MTEQQANQESEKHQILVRNYFESNLRKDEYIVRYVNVIENPIDSNDFHVYVGFQRLNDRRIILDPLDLFLNAYSQINP